MTEEKKELQRCYVLIAEWFANALGLAEDTKQFREGPFFPIGRPHTFAIIILSKLEITERLSEKYEFQFTCKRGDLICRATKNYRSGHPFSEVLETFIELAVYYGTAETRKNILFAVHKDVENLFVELEELGFAKRSEQGFQWTSKLDPIMKNICNYEFFENQDSTSQGLKVSQKKPFQYL